MSIDTDKQPDLDVTDAEQAALDHMEELINNDHKLLADLDEGSVSV